MQSLAYLAYAFWQFLPWAAWITSIAAIASVVYDLVIVPRKFREDTRKKAWRNW